jgi:hypothetical protein
MGMTSSGIQFLLEAQSASSLRVDARPASSLWVDAQPVCSLPTAQVVHDVGTGYGVSGNGSGSHANILGSEYDLGEEGFIYPRRTKGVAGREFPMYTHIIC